jgi:hypothetical protein
VVDRGHPILTFVAVLTAVLSMTACGHAQQNEKEGCWRPGLTRAYADERPPMIESMRLPPRAADHHETDPFLGMLHQTLSRCVTDSESMQALGSLLVTSVDPREKADVLRRCRSAVYKRLKEKKCPLDLDQGRVVSMGNDATLGLLPSPSSSSDTASPSEDDPPLMSDTKQAAVSKVAERRKLDLWQVSFHLRYRDIPLDKTSNVVITVSGDDIEIDWRNLPDRAQLPTSSALEPNVSSDQAREAGLDDFRKLLEQEGAKAQVHTSDLKLEASTPRLNLWFPHSSPEVGKLAWTFSVSAFTSDRAHLGTNDYHIEACKPAGKTLPRILAQSPSLNLPSSASGSTAIVSAR